MDRFEQPDVLVLGGGGILGEAWMSSLLAGLAEAGDFDPHGCEAYLGTSAGSIVAAALTAGVDPRSRLDELPEQPDVPDEAIGAEAPRPLARALGHAGRVAGPLAALTLPYMASGGALLRRAALGRVTPGRRSLAQLGSAVDEWDLDWDGRLRISAVDMESGRRVMFGEQGAPEASVADAVQASCAIPGFFRPIEIGGRRYVDGGVWSPTSMDRAPAGRGSRVLCLNPTASLTPSREQPYGAMGLLSRSLASIEAAYLERRGVQVEVVAPDAASTAAMAGRLMDGRLRGATLAAGLAQGRALATSKVH
ncbi:MAG TPA: patatin-like phospholipase family protein [Thermoleophilaceae bacterium]|nr:patatin-like phospholipase family protein [Thermoleophilaceae bacterium]